MHRKLFSESGIFSPRVFLAFLFCSTGVLLAISTFTGVTWRSLKPHDGMRPERYMPVPGGEADDLNRLEAEWHDRLTYPTGLFDPTWLRIAAVQDALLQRSIPAGGRLDLSQSLSPLALNPSGRGTGPSLQGKVPGPLPDPVLELHDANGATLETNDNWKDSPNRAEIEATGIPPGHDLESAIIRSTGPSGYTAILRGKTGSGIAVVEIYNIR